MAVQQLIVGNGAIQKIKDLLLQKGFQTIFIVMGKHLNNEDQHNNVLSFASFFQQYRYIKDGANVATDEIDQCFRDYSNKNIESIIAIGGGSVMDLAKGIIFQQMKAGPSIKPFFVAVPTTAGSGSEATQIAVVYHNKTKSSWEASDLLPDVAILDPQLTVSLSPQLTAISGADALAQAIESFWNVNATSESEFFAKQAISTLIEYLPLAVHQPSLEIREKVLLASHKAGQAINVTRTTGPHALSYFLTSQYNIPHGQAVALFLPVFFLYNSEVNLRNCNHPGGVESVERSLKNLFQQLGVTKSSEASEFIRRFLKNIGLATELKELGIDKTMVLDKLVDEVNEQRFKNNPVAFDRSRLLDLFEKHL